MRLFRIVFCSLLAVGSSEGVDPATLAALQGLSPEQLKAVLAMAGGDAGHDVHVGGSNGDAAISAPQGILIAPEAPEEPEATELLTQPEHESDLLTPPEPASNPLTQAEPEPENPLTPVEPENPLTPVEPENSLTPAEPENTLTQIAQDLAPTVEELSSDNPLTPVGSPDRIENEDEELLADGPSEDINPDEDRPIEQVNEQPKIIITPAPIEVSTPANVTQSTTQAVVTEENALLAAMSKLSPAEIQAILHSAQQPTATMTELATGQINAGQDALTDDVTEVATDDVSDAATDYGSRADPMEVTEDQDIIEETPEIVQSTQTEEGGVTVVNPNPGITVNTEAANTDQTDITSVTPVEEEIVSELPILTSTEEQPEVTSTEEELVVTSTEEPVHESVAQDSTAMTTEEDTTNNPLPTAELDLDEYSFDYSNLPEDKLQPWDYSDDYDDGDYDGEYEDEEGDYSGFGSLLDSDSFFEDDLNAEAQDVDPGILDSIAKNYRLEEVKEIDEIEEEFSMQLDEDKANWNFAFFLIVFVLVATGVYYVVNMIRTKFFPKNVSFKEYLTKRWRYWDSGDEAQTYSLLPGQDQDIKTAVSSEPKQEWNNDDW